MKRSLLTVLAVVAATSVVIVGPELLDVYRLQSYITSSAEAYEANGGPWPHTSDACVACHGVNGSSLHQAYPSLAAQPAPYIAAQLRDFTSGARVAPMMNAMARALRDDEIGPLADYFAHQPAQANRFFKADEALRKQGERIVAAGGCAACHGEGLMGREQFPRLAGQGYDYLLKQLNGFADGSRRDPGRTMNQLASAWRPDERRAIATFLASH